MHGIALTGLVAVGFRAETSILLLSRVSAAGGTCIKNQNVSVPKPHDVHKQRRKAFVTSEESLLSTTRKPLVISTEIESPLTGHEWLTVFQLRSSAGCCNPEPWGHWQCISKCQQLCQEAKSMFGSW